jgi:hypothetical protein
MTELRVVVATLVRKFEFQLDRKQWSAQEWEKASRDEFVLKKGNLPVMIQTRT